ncbi:MAG: hypothetical protein ACRCXZ_05375 [Patescibacteria group bacterium]
MVYDIPGLEDDRSFAAEACFEMAIRDYKSGANFDGHNWVGSRAMISNSEFTKFLNSDYCDERYKPFYRFGTAKKQNWIWLQCHFSK